MRPKILVFAERPRAGSSAGMLLRCFEYSKNIIMWPYEFFYFQIFNTAAKNKKSENIIKINDYFYKTSFVHFFQYLKKNNINYINEEIFKNKLYNVNRRKKTNSIDYLYHIFDCYNASLKKRKKYIKFLLINTTARGFDWSIKKNFIFFKTDRNSEDCLNSQKNKMLVTSSLKNYFSLSGKKNFFYWLTVFKNTLDKLKKIKSENEINLIFENISYSDKIIQKIRLHNFIKINKKLKLAISKEKSNYYFKLKRDKRKLKTITTKIEDYCIKKILIQDSKINFISYFIKVIYLLNDLNNKKKTAGYNMSFIVKLFIIYNFIKYYFIRNDTLYLKKLFIKNSKFVKYENLF